MTQPVTQPVLSIVVPAYNVETCLEQSLRSYCDEQLAGALQVIVVNDGSTDATQAIAETFVQTNPSIFTLINKENGGHGSAINVGFQAATGKYFRVIDADDWVDSQNLVHFCHKLQSIETNIVVDTKCEVNAQTGARTTFPLPDCFTQNETLAFEQVCAHEELCAYLMIHTLTLKRSYLAQIGVNLLEHTFYEDFQFVVESTISVQNICFLDINVYQYAVGNPQQSVADSNYVQKWEDHTRVTNALLGLYESKKDTFGEESARLQYLLHRCVLLCNTHYNIALIFDKDRRRGLRRAKEFHGFLQEKHPTIAKHTNTRYHKALLLHYAGVNSQEQLNKLRK